MKPIPIVIKIIKRKMKARSQECCCRIFEKNAQGAKC